MRRRCGRITNAVYKLKSKRSNCMVPSASMMIFTMPLGPVFIMHKETNRITGANTNNTKKIQHKTFSSCRKDSSISAIKHQHHAQPACVEPKPFATPPIGFGDMHVLLAHPLISRGGLQAVLSEGRSPKFEPYPSLVLTDWLPHGLSLPQPLPPYGLSLPEPLPEPLPQPLPQPSLHAACFPRQRCG